MRELLGWVGWYCWGFLFYWVMFEVGNNPPPAAQLPAVFVVPAKFVFAMFMLRLAVGRIRSLLR